MLRLVAVLAVVCTAAACTPEQIAEVQQAQSMRVPAVRREIVVAKPATQSPQKSQKGQNDFLRWAAALHNDAFLVCTRAHESDTAGGYRAFNPSGPYYGAYQFLQHTWNNTAMRAGIPRLSGVDILNVMPFYQDLLAYDLHSWAGNGPWAGRC